MGFSFIMKALMLGTNKEETDATVLHSFQRRSIKITSKTVVAGNGDIHINLLEIGVTRGFFLTPG